MKEVSGYNPSKDPRLINCKTECGNERCFAKRYGLFAEKTCPNFKEPMPLTNADRIRSMTDEELAELWWERVDCGECPVHKECKLTGQDCKRLALDWLKQEVEDDK